MPTRVWQCDTSWDQAKLGDLNKLNASAADERHRQTD